MFFLERGARGGGGGGGGGVGGVGISAKRFGELCVPLKNPDYAPGNHTKYAKDNETRKIYRHVFIFCI